jgi:hypothetical protein
MFGNAGGNYTGSILDQTGTNDNISWDPMFIDTVASPPDLAISSLSVCAPSQSPCGQLIGALAAVVPTGVDDDAVPTPSATRIASVHPNPFNPSTRIAFELRARSHVEIAIYDVSGRRIAVVVDGEMGAGRHEAVWHGRTAAGGAVASGIYFCTLRAGDAFETRKIVLVR